MIQTQMIGDRIRTYSDAGMQIRQDQTGILYYDAVDVPSMGYTYTETDIPIPKEEINVDYTDLEMASRFLLNDNLVELPEQEQPDYFNENEPEPNYFNEQEV